jgi:hypothetical protein
VIKPEIGLIHKDFKEQLRRFLVKVKKLTSTKMWLLFHVVDNVNARSHKVLKWTMRALSHVKYWPKYTLLM